MSRPRIRSLKPECWQDAGLGEVSLFARLLFVGLITQADDSGRVRADTALLRSQIYPYDHALPLRKIEGWLEELDRVGLVAIYEHQERRFLALSGWEKHQKVDHAKDSELPPPPKRGSSRKNAKPRERSRERANGSEALARTRSPRARPRIGSDLGADQGNGAPSGAPPTDLSRKRDGKQIRQVFDAWIEATGRTGQTDFSEKRRRLITKALDRYPLEDVLDAVRGWRHSPHHRGENDRQTVYNNLELLLRDAEHIEKFRDLERGATPPAADLAKRLAETDRRIREAYE